MLNHCNLEVFLFGICFKMTIFNISLMCLSFLVKLNSTILMILWWFHIIKYINYWRNTEWVTAVIRLRSIQSTTCIQQKEIVSGCIGWSVVWLFFFVLFCCYLVDRLLSFFVALFGWIMISLREKIVFRVSTAC